MRIKKIVTLEEKERENLLKFLDYPYPCEDVDCEGICCEECPLNDIVNDVKKAKRRAELLLSEM